MKRIFKFFGFVAVNDVINLIDKEANHWENEKKKLTEVNHFPCEDEIKRLSFYNQCCKNIKTQILILKHSK